MSFMKSNKNTTYLLLGGSLLALGLGTVAYVLKNQKKEEIVAGTVLDRNTVIKVLKELRKEMFTVFTNFSMVSMQIKQQTQGKARPEEVKAMLLEQPMFRSEIVSVEDNVYEQFGVTREQFQQVCEVQFGQDPEVRALQQDMKDSFDKSFTGIPPDCKVEIPVFLTAALTFQILEKVMIESAVKLNHKLLEFQESGEEVSFNNPKLMQVMQQLKMDSSKKDILAEFGLDKYEESAQKILQYATQQYQMSNADNFGEKMSKLDVKYQQTMEKLLTTGPITEIQLRKSMVIDVAPFAGMGRGMTKAAHFTKAVQIEEPVQDETKQEVIVEEVKVTVVEEQVVIQETIVQVVVDQTQDFASSVSEIVTQQAHLVEEAHSQEAHVEVDHKHEEHSSPVLNDAHIESN